MADKIPHNETARQLMETLGMKPHPEGGWYVETFRDVEGPDGRSRSTAIYYLLEQGQASHWHSVDAVEVWLWHAGSPLELSIAVEGEPVRTEKLGADIVGGERPQGIVPEGAWQSARPCGDWVLVSCLVAPGFDFAHFKMAPKNWTPIV
ncbi:cupin domain-containing protein [Maricaulis sp. CAU 1757]